MVKGVSSSHSQGSKWNSYLPALPSRKTALHILYNVNQIAFPIMMIAFISQIGEAEGRKSKCIHACKEQKFAGDNNVYTNAVCWAVCKLPGIEALIAAGKTVAEAVKIIKEIRDEF